MTENVQCVCCMAIRRLCEDDCQLNHKPHRHGKPNPPDEGSLCCAGCQLALSRLPKDIAEAYALLPTLLEEPGSSRGGEVRSKNPDPPMPLTDAHDLAWERIAPAGPLALARLAENAEYQVGHPPVVSVLWWRIQDILTYRQAGESGPGATVEAMCQWLSVRADWLAQSYTPVHEYAAELVHLHGVLQALVGRPEPDERPKALSGVPCPRCHAMDVVQHHDGSRECRHPDCRTIWRAEEWDRVTRAVSKAIRAGQLTRD